MTPEQIRMARAALNWSCGRLAALCGIHGNTLWKIENSFSGSNPKTIKNIQRVFEAHGVIFIDETPQKGCGITFKRILPQPPQPSQPPQP